MYLLIDIGGTKTRLVTSDGENLDDALILDTPQYFKTSLALIEQNIPKLKRGFEAAVVGLPGPLNEIKSQLIKSPNLPDWVDKPIKDSLQKILGVPVFLENDASLVALGEASFGSGKGKRIVVYHTISTGVGGARIIDGKVDQNFLGFEPGHQIVSLEGVELESLISGAALSKHYGKDPEQIDDPEIWDKVAKILAIGINNTLVYWSPEIVILGGSVMKSIDIDKVRQYTRETVKIFPSIPPIEKSTLGDLGGLYGGLTYLKDKNS